MAALRVVGRRSRTEGRGVRVQLHRRAGAAVAPVMPGQGQNAAAAAQIQRRILWARPGKPGQQQRVGAKARAGRRKNPGAMIENFHTMFHDFLLSGGRKIRKVWGGKRKFRVNPVNLLAVRRKKAYT